MAQQLTTQQIENILLDVGVVYLNYGELTERVLAPTRGGGSFSVEQDVREIERDGALGKEMGMRRVIKEDATLTVNVMDMSIANLKAALAGSTATATKITSTKTGEILSTEYFSNITWVGVDMAGKNKIITLYNALSDNGLTLNFTDKDEAVVEMAFAGHRDPTDTDQALYEIEEVEDPANNLTGLAISTGTLEPAFAGSVYGYGASVANATSSITVTPTGAAATWIKVNGVVVPSGSASGAIPLAVGINIIKVRVHQAGQTDIEYTLYITRQAA